MAFVAFATFVRESFLVAGREICGVRTTRIIKCWKVTGVVIVRRCGCRRGSVET